MSNRIMQKEIKETTVFSLEEHASIIDHYREIEQLYNAGIKEIRTKLEILDDEFHVKFDHNPIHHIEYRLKSPTSIINKLEKQNLPISMESATNNIRDIAGVRVICNYIKDIYRIAQLLTRQDDITLLVTKDYIKSPKENGYRSLHLVVAVPVFLAEDTLLVPVEIQIRTIAMDFWASLEHQLRYKNDNEVSDDIRRRLKKCADEITDLDDEMESIHNKLKGKHEI